MPFSQILSGHVLSGHLHGYRWGDRAALVAEDMDERARRHLVLTRIRGATLTHDDNLRRQTPCSPATTKGPRRGRASPRCSRPAGSIAWSPTLGSRARWRKSPPDTPKRASTNSCPGTSTPPQTDVKVVRRHRLRRILYRGSDLNAYLEQSVVDPAEQRRGREGSCLEARLALGDGRRRGGAGQRSRSYVVSRSRYAEPGLDAPPAGSIIDTATRHDCTDAAFAECLRLAATVLGPESGRATCRSALRSVACEHG